MTDRFHETLKRASERVAKWPEWKQRMLGMTAKELKEYYQEQEKKHDRHIE